MLEATGSSSHLSHCTVGLSGPLFALKVLMIHLLLINNILVKTVDTPFPLQISIFTPKSLVLTSPLQVVSLATGNPFSLSLLYEVIIRITSLRYFEIDMFSLQKLSFFVTSVFCTTFCFKPSQVAELAILAESNSRLYHVCGLVSGLLILLLRPFSPSTRQV